MSTKYRSNLCSYKWRQFFFFFFFLLVNSFLPSGYSLIITKAHPSTPAHTTFFLRFLIDYLFLFSFIFVGSFASEVWIILLLEDALILSRNNFLLRAFNVYRFEARIEISGMENINQNKNNNSLKNKTHLKMNLKQILLILIMIVKMILAQW